MFSIIGRCGWSFISKDYFPLPRHLFKESINRNFEPALARSLGYFPGVYMFENVRPDLRFYQPRNFARSYRARFANDFANKEARGESVFRYFYEQNRANILLINRYPAYKHEGGLGLTFCARNYELTSTFASLLNAAPKAAPRIWFVSNHVSRYEELYKSLSGDALSATIADVGGEIYCETGFRRVSAKGLMRRFARLSGSHLFRHRALNLFRKSYFFVNPTAQRAAP
jgi:hypothetical protein